MYVIIKTFYLCTVQVSKIGKQAKLWWYGKLHFKHVYLPCFIIIANTCPGTAKRRPFHVMSYCPLKIIMYS